MTASSILDAAVADIRGPIQKFLDTGIFWEHSWEQRGVDELVPHVTVRKIARMVAREHKRPFICAGHVGKSHRWIDGRWARDEDARPVGGWLRVPRRTYLMPLVGSLLAGATLQANRPWENPIGLKGEPAIGVYESPRIWKFTFTGEDFFNDFLKNALADAGIRKAMRLPT